jgi:hypothetical protein
VLGAVAHQAEGGDVPEGGGPAVAQDDLVALGEAEQVGDALAHGADEVLHRGLAVRGAEDRGAQRGEVLDLLRADLAGAGAEAAVPGQEVGGKGQGRVLLGHPASLAPRPEAWDVRSTTRTDDPAPPRRPALPAWAPPRPPAGGSNFCLGRLLPNRQVAPCPCGSKLCGAGIVARRRTSLQAARR